MTQRKYKVLDHTTIYQLMAAVNEHLLDGYILAGGFHVYTTSHDYHYCQAVVQPV